MKILLDFKGQKEDKMNLKILNDLKQFTSVFNLFDHVDIKSSILHDYFMN
jgi:hypothetical protein